MIAIVAHDAGGAEIVSSYIKQSGPMEYLFVLDGPAVSIFERKLGKVGLTSLDDALLRADWFLCGTSGSSFLEWSAIKNARELKKRSVAFLDHWINYKERFIRANECCLPDEIWVGDSVAEKLATNTFSNIVVKLIDNPYFKDIQLELENLTSENKPIDQFNVLYVSEPIREQSLRIFGNELHHGYGEDDALIYFLSHIAVLGKPVDQLIIRIHPSEKEGKYNWVAKKFDLPIIISKNEKLLLDITRVGVVVGCNTMAMVVGLLANKRVISCIPPGGSSCNLPHTQIELLQRLV